MKRFFVFVALISVTACAHAQRPVMLTEQAGTLGAGRIELGIGLEYFKKHQAPAADFPFSELRLMVAGSHFGVADNVDFNLDWRGGLLAHFPAGKSGFDWGDLMISSKLRVLKEDEDQPAVGLRSSVKLPNTSYLPYRLGSDQTDFFMHVLVSREWGNVITAANIGFGIVGDPLNPGRQDDLVMFSSAVILPISSVSSVFLEVYGFDGHLDYDDKVMVRFGASSTIGGLQWNAYGGIRVAGDNRDFATAFEASENWSVALFVSKSIQF
ncbi:MAG: hypothetical protein OEM41_00945 [Ignavibacteria bacterium]|nr:hypothetical protein [Ignavibacteria bacterium]